MDCTTRERLHLPFTVWKTTSKIMVLFAHACYVASVHIPQLFWRRLLLFLLFLLHSIEARVSVVDAANTVLCVRQVSCRAHEAENFFTMCSHVMECPLV